jgi:hypothetical protein
MISSGSKLAEDIRYGLAHWEGLTRFLDDGRLELDTNPVENAIRPICLTRKNALFAGHEVGAEDWALLSSIVATASSTMSIQLPTSPKPSTPSSTAIRRAGSRNCKRQADLSFTHKLGWAEICGLEPYDKVGEAREAAPYDGCSWRAIPSTVEISAQAGDGGHVEGHVARNGFPAWRHRTVEKDAFGVGEDRRW